MSGLSSKLQLYDAVAETYNGYSFSVTKHPLKGELSLLSNKHLSNKILHCFQPCKMCYHFSLRNSDPGTSYAVVSRDEVVCSSHVFPSGPVSLLLSPDGKGHGTEQAAGLGAVGLACPFHPLWGEKSGETGLRVAFEVYMAWVAKIAPGVYKTTHRGDHACGKYVFAIPDMRLP